MGLSELIIDTSTGWNESWIFCKQYGYIAKLADGSICVWTCENFEKKFEEA